MKIQSVAVFGGSRPGTQEIFSSDATELGRLIAALDLKLVYGGGSGGLMGKVADAVLAHGGKLIGVLSRSLSDWEEQHRRLSEVAILPDMHSRKKMLFELADAAIVLPGGFGTLDECFELLSWNQLRLHDKRVYILNSGGFYSELYNHLKRMEREGFLYEPLENRIVLCDNPRELFNKIE